MGIIRSGVVIFLSFLLFITVFAGNIFLTLGWSLEYENVKPVVSDFGKDLVNDSGVSQMLEDNYDLMIYSCNLNDSGYVFSEEGLSVEIPCSEIEKGSENVINYSVNEIVNNIYYKDYNCSFFECIKNEGQPYVLISEKSMDYFKSNYNLILIFMIILFVLLFVFVESKGTAFIISGVLIVFASLPFRKFDWILSFLPDGNVSEFFLAFFTKSYNVFVVMTIIGVSLFILGISFHFFGWGIKISEFLRKHFNKKLDEAENKKGEAPLSSSNEDAKEMKKEALALKEEALKLKEEAIKLSRKNKKN